MGVETCQQNLPQTRILRMCWKPTRSQPPVFRAGAASGGPPREDPSLSLLGSATSYCLSSVWFRAAAAFTDLSSLHISASRTDDESLGGFEACDRGLRASLIFSHGMAPKFRQSASTPPKPASHSFLAHIILELKLNSRYVTPIVVCQLRMSVLPASAVGAAPRSAM